MARAICSPSRLDQPQLGHREPAALGRPDQGQHAVPGLAVRQRDGQHRGGVQRGQQRLSVQPGAEDPGVFDVGDHRRVRGLVHPGRDRPGRRVDRRDQAPPGRPAQARRGRRQTGAAAGAWRSRSTMASASSSAAISRAHRCRVRDSLKPWFSSSTRAAAVTRSRWRVMASTRCRASGGTGSARRARAGPRLPVGRRWRTGGGGRRWRTADGGWRGGGGGSADGDDQRAGLAAEADPADEQLAGDQAVLGQQAGPDQARLAGPADRAELGLDRRAGGQVDERGERAAGGVAGLGPDQVAGGPVDPLDRRRPWPPGTAAPGRL